MNPFTEEEIKSLVKQSYWQGYKDAGVMLIKLAGGETLDDVMNLDSDVKSNDNNLG